MAMGLVLLTNPPGDSRARFGRFSLFWELALTLFGLLGTYPAPSERFFKNLVKKTRNPTDLTRAQLSDSGRNDLAANAPLNKSAEQAERPGRRVEATGSFASLTAATLFV